MASWMDGLTIQEIAEERRRRRARSNRRGHPPFDTSALQWRRFQLERPPSQPGLYAITRGKEWLYIGRSTCIATRVSHPNHPAQITKDIPGLSYQWALVADVPLGRAEIALHRQHRPQWCGGLTIHPEWEAIGPTCAIRVPLSPEEEARITAARGLLFEGLE